jgi:hypothetical protein
MDHTSPAQQTNESANKPADVAPKKRTRRPAKAKSAATTTEGMTAPHKLKLLVTVVDRAKADFYADILQGFEVNMQTVMAAHGTVSTEMQHLLGLEDTDKAVLFSFIKEKNVSLAMDTLETKFRTIKNGKGIAFTIPLSSVVGVAIYQFLSNNREHAQ